MTSLRCNTKSYLHCEDDLDLAKMYFLILPGPGHAAAGWQVGALGAGAGYRGE